MIKKILAVIMMVMMIGYANAGAIDLVVGSDTEVVVNKRVDLENLDTKGDYSAQHYDVSVQIPLGNRIVVTPKAGISHCALEIDNVEFNSGVGWNIGMDAKANIYTLAVGETDILDFSLTGGYRFMRVDLDEVVFGPVAINNPIESILTTHEWEIGAQVSRDLKDLTGLAVTPYFGIVYSDMVGDFDANLSVVSLDEDITARNNVGLRLGAVAKPLDNMILSLDVKLVDEFALAGKIAIKF